MIEYADNPEAIDELLYFYSNNIAEETYSFEGTPSALVIVTDSKKYRILHGMYEK